MDLRQITLAAGMTAATLIAVPARADILFIDTNNQAVERKALDKLARKYGETVHVVKGDGKEMDEIFAKAERGEITLETVVGSGHSMGDEFGGTQGSTPLYFGEYLAKYPNAAAQVRAFIGLGCYTGTRGNSDVWQQRFPNATIVAGFAALAPTGDWSSAFLTQVYSTFADARKKAGGSDALAADLGQREASRKAVERTLAMLGAMSETTGTWAVCGNFHDPKPLTRAKLDHDLAMGELDFRDVFEGLTAVPSDLHHSPLRSYYSTLQSSLGSTRNAKERADTHEKIEKTIRLIFYDSLKTRWATEHATEITAANDALAKAGVAPGIPDAKAIAKMSRKEILKRFADLVTALGDADPAKKKALTDGAKKTIAAAFAALRDVDPAQLPFQWIADH